MRIPILLPVTLLFFCASFHRTVCSDYDDGRSELVQWQILTKLNFSSQIRLHPHLLLLITVPWSGESRTLMKELANEVNNKKTRFGTLKMMVLYRSNERMLADAIGATEGITLMYYHYSSPYKYRGRLRVQNILSSINFILSLTAQELSFNSLNTPEELRSFLNTSDKALLLLEFCGWTSKLLAMEKDNKTESSFGVSEEFNRTHSAEPNKEKETGNGSMVCSIENGFNSIPWLSEFTSVNDSALLKFGNMTSTSGPCTVDEFRRFESFLPQFIAIMKEFFLPPERLRFGLVSKKSLLSLLNIEETSSWSLMLNFAGCPTCSKVLRESDDLRAILQTHASFVTELQGDFLDVPLELPANKPSAILFIDRSSESSSISKRSRESLGAFRELALQYQILDKMSGQNAFNLETLAKNFQPSKGVFVHPRLNMLEKSEKITLKEKTSVMIINEGKPVAIENFLSDIQGQGSSLHDILVHALQQKKQLKLSSLAKDVGFQLLSDDFDVKVADSAPMQTEVQSDKNFELSPQDVHEGITDSAKDRMPQTTNLYIEGVGGTVQSSRKDNAKNIDPGEQVSAVSEHYEAEQVVYFAKNGKSEEKTQSNSDERKQRKGFSGSFFFYDGQYRLLKALTGGVKIPSVVIIDPILQQHYVLPLQADFSRSLLSDFVDRFLNGTLSPHQQSQPLVPRYREAPSPPFVNLDFHETDPIPRVTANTFSELVLGNQSDSGNAGHAWNRDVLVLFSNSWCGFCQRMEMVVREVHRAIKGRAKLLNQGSAYQKTSVISDDAKNSVLNLPLVYLMDCTLNDCGLILKSRVQRELYPCLLLFPAGRKNAILYGGDVAVSDVIKFLTDHGCNSYGLARESRLQTGALPRKEKEILNKEFHLSKDMFQEVLLKDRMDKTEVKHNWIQSHSLTVSDGTRSDVNIGSLLIATDKLMNAHPFEESKILIVNADQSTGFHGLILNKHISWDSLEELEGLQLLKEAPLSFGGPVIRQGMPLCALARNLIGDNYLEVLPNINFVDQRATVNLIEGFRVGNRSIDDYWFFLGFCSWGWDQLFQEIAEGAWNITNGAAVQINWPTR